MKPFRSSLFNGLASRLRSTPERLPAGLSPRLRQAMPVLFPVPILALVLVLVHVSGVLPKRVPDRSATTTSISRSFVTAYDTINGDRITDRSLIERIEHVAAGVPSHLLAHYPRDPHVRYLAQGFGSADVAPVFNGVFHDPAAALAFGCALQDEPESRCDMTAVAGGSTLYADIPGIRCTPMRLALGAPAHEPDRCEAGG